VVAVTHRLEMVGPHFLSREPVHAVSLAPRSQ
jgi:hypothetical protein